MLLHKEFNFEGQVDASTKSKFSEHELLSKPWYSSTFVVPNFSNMVDWAQRFALESEKGNTVVAVIPARTNTNWFHDFVISKAAEIRFIKGRLTFPGYKSQSPYRS
jgi:site-specific DNA-methyltransferase (adenine-specific)